MSEYSDTLGKLSKTLIAKSDTMFKHNGNRGDSREVAVIDFLSQVFPNAYGFSKGEIFDSSGANSGEVDIIMYDTLHSPVFKDGSDKIYCPNESSYGAIEVKSNLTKAELKNCQMKVDKYWSLLRPQAPPNTRYITPYIPFGAGGALRVRSSDNIPTYGVFAYQSSIALETIEEELRDNKTIGFIVVPREFIFIGLTFQFGDKIMKNFLIKTPNSIAIWILLLQTCLTTTNLIGTSVNGLLISALTEAMDGRD